MTEMEALDVRLSKCEQDIASLMKNVSSIQVNQACTLERLDNLISTMGEVKQSVASLQQKPVQRWDSLIGQCIGLIAAAVIGLLFGGM